MVVHVQDAASPYTHTEMHTEIHMHTDIHAYHTSAHTNCSSL